MQWCKVSCGFNPCSSLERASNLWTIILSRLGHANLTMPKFFIQLMVNFLCSFHSSPSEATRPVEKKFSIQLSETKRKIKNRRTIQRNFPALVSKSLTWKNTDG